MQVLTAEEMARLSAEQKADLIDRLWASWDKESLALSGAQRAELDRRMAEFQANPDDELTWEELKQQLLGTDHGVVRLSSERRPPLTSGRQSSGMTRSAKD